VAAAIFEHLHREMKDHGGTLVLVWLPVQGEIEKEARFWRPWVGDVAAEVGVPFIDLSLPLRELSRAQAGELFINRNDTDYIDAAGHYSEAGHEWVAEELLRRLGDLPEAPALLTADREREVGPP
jgi:hypothetical protein